MDKRYRKLFKELRQHGWTVEQTNKGHFKVTSPEGAIIIAASTASDHRAHLNFLGRLRRAGWRGED